MMKKYLYQGHELDREKMIKECGDVIWYVAELAAGLGMTLEDVCQLNINKLRRRYPDGLPGAEPPPGGGRHMTITEATRRAMAEGKNIARRWYDRRIIIKPDTSPDCCLIWVEGSKRPPVVRWNPDADDLISDDWEVTGDWYEP